MTMPKGQQNKITRDELIHRLPKVALHRHLEGSLRLETLLEINQSHGMNLPAHTMEKMRKLVTMAHVKGNFDTYLSKFATIRRFYRSPEIIKRFAYEAVVDAARDNVRYLELRFTPRALSKVSMFSFEEVTGWVCGAVAEASRRYPIKTRLIISMNRNEDLYFGERAYEVALAFRDQGVVAIDLAGYEVGYPTQPFVPIFVKAKQEGLGVTVHGGEWLGADNVRYAIENLYADRIGHGVRVVEDSRAMQLAHARQVVFETCPTSNIQSGVFPDMAHHPLRDMFFLGLLTTINTDNTCISHISLSDEISRVIDSLGFRLSEIKQMIMYAARAAFLPPGERAALVEQIETELAAFPDNGEGLQNHEAHDV